MRITSGKVHFVIGFMAMPTLLIGLGIFCKTVNTIDRIREKIEHTRRKSK